jgi:DNA-binding LacI/PurR family transcriptional regulator
VDAIVAGNDQMAIGAIAYLIEKGIRIPEEIAVIGFNDNVQSSLITPSLSTIHVPKKEMGAKAIELFDRRHNNKTAVRILIQLEGHLVIRNTTDPNVTSCWNLDW